MGQAIGQVLSLGVGVALSPVPIVAVIVMLGTRRGPANARAFLVGWLVGLGAVGAIVLVISGGAHAGTRPHPALWVSLLELGVGLLLGLVAVRSWRHRPRGDEKPRLPRWLRAVDTFTPTRAAAMGVALSAVNPKNLLLTVAAATAIAQTDARTVGEIVALAVFAVVGALGPGLPLLAVRVLGERSQALLADLQDWMARHNAAIITAICLVLAAKSIGDAISGLSS